MSAPALVPLLTLREAAERLFGDGGKVRALRTEIDKGNLVPAKIAGTYYVTEDQLRELFVKCQGNQRGHTSISTKRKKRGSSGTPTRPSEPDAVKTRLKLLTERSPSTSRKNGDRKPPSTGQVLSFSKTSS